MPHPQKKFPPVLALVCDKGDQIDQLLSWGATRLQACDLEIAGTVQQTHARQHRCCDDFSLRNLATGKCHLISQNLGPGSQGCRLDYGKLADLVIEIDQGLSSATDAMILNRFGFSESQGGGFRPLIERAIEMNIPLLLAVNRAYYRAWQDYAGAVSVDRPATEKSLMEWCSDVTSATNRVLSDA